MSRADRGLLYGLGRFTPLRRRTRAAAALVLAPALVLGTLAVAATLRYRSAEAADALQSRPRERDPLGAVKFSRRPVDVLVQVAPRSHDRPAEHLVHRLRRLRLRLLSRLAI